MGNRMLKESICTSEEINKLTAFQETFFYRLIVNCDDYGRMDARPAVLASMLYPLRRDIRDNQITDALRALTSAELVTIYEVDGKPFLQMKTWEKHQRIRNLSGKYPAPGEAAADCGGLQQIAADCSESPPEVEVEVEDEVEEEKEEKKKKKNASTPKRFIPPTLDEVTAYCKERGSTVDPKRFWDYFTAGNWKDSKGNPVRNWKQKLITWEGRVRNGPDMVSGKPESQGGKQFSLHSDF